MAKNNISKIIGGVAVIGAGVALGLAIYNRLDTIKRELNDDEFKLYLEKKLLEEVKEVIDGSKENKLEELADLYEVLITYARIYKINLEDIINQAKEKNNLRGSFNKKILLIETKK